MLVVGGGGGGGALANPANGNINVNQGGGGGAGGVIQRTVVLTAANIVTINVGWGGDRSSQTLFSSNGGDTTVSFSVDTDNNIVAKGGGYGAGLSNGSFLFNGGNGGSGGGGGGNAYGASVVSGTGITGQGFGGGPSASAGSGGGGGGAGGAGASNGIGGIGVLCTLPSISSAYPTYYWGGGGAAGNGHSGEGGVAGGLGGGGNGGCKRASAAAINLSSSALNVGSVGYAQNDPAGYGSGGDGGSNTGGGGGGASKSDASPPTCFGGRGGSGVVVIGTPPPLTINTLLVCTQYGVNCQRYNSAGVLYFCGNGIVQTYYNNVITTVIGNGTVGYSGDGSQAINARIGVNKGINFDSRGNIYITDSTNHVIRKVDIVSGIITTIAGTSGISGNTGNGEQAISALLNQPHSLILDQNDNVYFSCYGDRAPGWIAGNAGANTGGGGGGGGQSSAAAGIGGSGIVLIAILTSSISQ